MRKKELFEKVLAYFRSKHIEETGLLPENDMESMDTELHYTTVFQLLVAVMLSAQCTDRRINMVTPALFSDYGDAASMAVAQEETIYEYVKSVSYPHSKARHLVAMSRALVDRFQGSVPQTLEELTQLPGVGRKTANVVLAIAFGQPALAVDTHVFRVSHRLGGHAHRWLLLHGRYVCTARSPKCTGCGLSALCPSAVVIPEALQRGK